MTVPVRPERETLEAALRGWESRDHDGEPPHNIERGTMAGGDLEVLVEGLTPEQSDRIEDFIEHLAALAASTASAEPKGAYAGASAVGSGPPLAPSPALAAAPDALEGERCGDCGAIYETVYNLPDELWKAICPKAWDGFGSGGLLCPGCADRRARTLGLHLFWSAGNGEYPAPDARRLETNPDPLKIVERRDSVTGIGAIRGRSREDRLRVWLALGGTQEEFDADYPPAPDARLAEALEWTAEFAGKMLDHPGYVHVERRARAALAAAREGTRSGGDTDE